MLLRIVISSVLGIIAFAILLFVPAGTLNYWQGWALLAVFSVMSLAPPCSSTASTPLPSSAAPMPA